jgi:DNA-binding CsgD family transcriptional regulator
VIVGRSTELEELDRLLESAGQGSSGRVLVVGDPGMGTTALLTAFATRAKRRGASVTSASITSAGAVLCSGLVADRSPVTVLLDDGGDADPAQLADLVRLADELATRPSLVVVASHPASSIRKALATWPRLVLRPLAMDDALVILRDELGDAAPSTVVFRLAEALDGNPLALREVPRLLTTDQRSGRAPLPAHLPVPAALDAAWGTVVDALPAGSRAAAVDLAVAGPRADLLAALGEQVGWSHADLAAVVDAGLAVTTADVTPRFVHAVVREVVLQRTAATTVQSRHAHAATLATQLGLPPRIVVHHLSHAVATADEAIASAVEAQARRAEGLDELYVASDAWQAAARLSTTGPARIARALSGLRLVITHGLDYAGTDALLDLLSGEQMEAECALWVEWLSTLQRSEADPDSALTAQFSTIRRARVAAPATLRALLWDAAMNAWSLGDTEAGLRAAREFVDVERTLGSTDDGVEPPWAGLALVAAGLFQAGEVALAMAMRRQAIERARDVDPTAVPFDRLLSIVFLDDLLLDTTPESASRLLVATQRQRDRSAPLACLQGIRAWRARASGDWTRALDILVEARPLAAVTGATGAQLGMGALAAELAGLQGRDAVLAAEVTHLRKQALRIGDRRRMATLDRAVGLHALAQGRLDDAVTVLGAAADAPFLGRGLRDAVLPARVDLIETLARQGRSEDARSRASSLSPLLAAMDDPLARALDLRSQALVAHGPDAEELLRTALAAHQEARDPFEEARTRLLLGEHLRRDRQRSAARACLLSAQRTFEQLEARPWLRRTQNELRAAGGRPLAPDGLESLTPQERSVADAVASGQSNREVAESLFLSPRTVEYHLGHVYRKLGVHGRSGLAHRLAGSGD